MEISNVHFVHLFRPNKEQSRKMQLYIIIIIIIIIIIKAFI